MGGSLSARDWARVALRVTRHARASRDELVEFQSARLRRIARHAWTHVPFYRALFDRAGVRPEDVRGVEDLARMPIVEKAELRRQPLPEIAARGVDPERLLARHTSGSTGRPFTIRRTRAEDRLLHLFRMRAHRQCGVRAFDRIASLVEPTIGGDERNRVRSLRHALGISRRRALSCFEPPETTLRQLDALAPAVIAGYPSALALVAQRLRRAEFPRVRPRTVLAGGEPLEPHVRARIAQAFAAPVFDLYGAHEFNLVAWQCPRGDALHVCDDNVIVEVLHDGRPAAEGERGEVVATGLHGFAMPFIRYRLGDIATRGAASCRCGQPFSTLSAIDGRTAHYLSLRGRTVHPFELTGRLLEGDVSWIDRHQLAQESPDAVVLRIAPLAPPPAGALERLERIAREVLGAGIGFRLELVDAFPPDPGGKFRSYVSLGEDGSDS
jgi:phenylacetate-CoA ligase